MDKLTPKQKLFIQEYLVDLNGTQAAIRAGYSAKTACEMANENLRKPHVKKYLEEAKEERSQKVGITAEWVLNELAIQYQSAKDADEKKYALKALELMGKHTNIGAFKDKLELSGGLTLSHEQMLDELE